MFCQHFNHDQRRYCSKPAVPGTVYCDEHLGDRQKEAERRMEKLADRLRDLKKRRQS